MSLKVQVTSKTLDQVQNKTLVVLAPNGKLPSTCKDSEAFLKAAEFKGEVGQVEVFKGMHKMGFDSLVVAGVDKGGPEDLKRAAAHTLKALKSNKLYDTAIDFSKYGGAQDKAENFLEGLYLTDYCFDEHMSKKSDKEIKVTFVVKANQKAKVSKAQKNAEILCKNINFARWLGDQPGNLMTPEILASEVKKAAKGTGLKVTVWNKDRIQKERMGSFLSVSLGGGPEPKFIIMEYSGAAKSKKPVCYVGKGITFDTGGNSLKPPVAMLGMKYDMCGGANVIATMLTIAQLKLKVNALGFVPSTENLAGGWANKPGDIVTARNGKTIEVNNTDAEGRLILADALVYASEKKPAYIVSAATLTGAMVIALGNSHTGFFTRNEKMNKKVEAATKKTNEDMWRMPCTQVHTDDMKGTYADLSNLGATRMAGSAQAAAFLHEFIENKVPYVHFDIAGTGSDNGNRFPYNPNKGASGVAIKTFVEMARNHR